MKRIHSVAFASMALVCGGLLLSSCGGSQEAAVDAEFPVPGQFVSDSLGVSITLPESPGWTFHKDPPVRESSYVTAQHESGDASFKLFVTPAGPDTDLDRIAKRRRDRFAALFGVSQLEDVLANVMRDERREVNGSPVLQWQAVTTPVARAEGDPARVVFMWIAPIPNERAYEGVGVVMYPAKSSPEQQTITEGFLTDIAFLMESFTVR